MILKHLKTLGIALTDLVFPVYCLSCGKEEKTYLCDDCLPHIARLERQVCIVCQKPSPFGKTHPECLSRNTVDGIISALPYADPMVKKIIEAFKYNFVSSLSQSLGLLLAAEIKTQNLSEYFAEFVIVPIPLHAKRYNERGFNQAELISFKLAELLKSKIDPGLVKRIKFTKPQTELKKEERKNNILGAFNLKGASASRKYLIIDDVVTTGSTLNETAKILKRAGAKEVWAATVAHG